MKNIVIGILIASCCFLNAKAQHQIIVTNNADFDRKAELVEVAISKQHKLVTQKAFILKNKNGVEVPYQLVYSDGKVVSSLLFQVDVKSKSKAVYTITAGKPAIVKPLTYARFVPERKDDFAWENDFAAYRMYGPALANENPSNGVDLWLKRTSDTIINKRFRDELKNGLSYHIDRGNGLDCYKVGHTLGAGGDAPFQNGNVWVGNHFNRYKVLENGPLRSTFILYYDQVKVGDENLTQEITISTIAGLPLNLASVKYSTSKIPFQLVAGIYTHDNKGVAYRNQKSGLIAYAEDAMQDATTNVGRNYVAVLFPSAAQNITEQDNHLLIHANYSSGKAFNYYFGGGWSKWQFPTDKDWFNAMERVAEMINKPLKVIVK